MREIILSARIMWVCHLRKFSFATVTKLPYQGHEARLQMDIHVNESTCYQRHIMFPVRKEIVCHNKSVNPRIDQCSSLPVLFRSAQRTTVTTKSRRWEFLHQLNYQLTNGDKLLKLYLFLRKQKIYTEVKCCVWGCSAREFPLSL